MNRPQMFLTLSILCFAPITSSRFYIKNQPDDSTEFSAVLYRISRHKEIRNASLVFWKAEFRLCSELFDANTTAPAPRGLIVKYQQRCFPDDIARLVQDRFDFILYSYSKGYYTPAGFTSSHFYRNFSTSAIPIYETDEDWEVFQDDISDIRVDIIEDVNPYRSFGFLVTYGLLSGICILLNLSKITAVYERFNFHYFVLESGFNQAIMLLLVETVNSVVIIALCVDYLGFFGIYNNRAFYPLMQIPPHLSNVTTLILFQTFNSALSQVDKKQASYRSAVAASYVLLVASLIPSTYDAYAFLTLKVKQTTVATAVNIFSIAYFTFVFGVLFLKAKKRSVDIFEVLKSAVNREKRANIERMSLYMRYSAMFMILYFFTLLGMGMCVALASGFGAMVGFGVCISVLTVVGYTQVLSLPGKSSIAATKLNSK